MKLRLLIAWHKNGEVAIRRVLASWREKQNSGVRRRCDYEEKKNAMLALKMEKGQGIWAAP